MQNINNKTIQVCLTEMVSGTVHGRRASGKICHRCSSTSQVSTAQLNLRSTPLRGGKSHPSPQNCQLAGSTETNGNPLPACDSTGSSGLTLDVSMPRARGQVTLWSPGNGKYGDHWINRREIMARCYEGYFQTSVMEGLQYF